MFKFKLEECHRDNLCIDCDDIECKHAGELQLCKEYGWKELLKRWNTRISMQNIILKAEAEIKSSEKFIREYDDSIAQKAYHSGMTKILKIIKEEGGVLQ